MYVGITKFTLINSLQIQLIVAIPETIHITKSIVERKLQKISKCFIFSATSIKKFMKMF